jgi:anti-anti-sigma factor
VLNVTTQNLGDVTILRCSGRIVRGEETALLCAAIQQQQRNIMLDLTEIETIDAAGIGLLVTLQAAGFYLTLMNPNSHVREILRITKVDSILEIRETRPTQELAVEFAATA